LNTASPNHIAIQSNVKS